MKARTTVVAALAAASLAPASADVVTLTFDGIAPAKTPAEGTNSVLGSEILGYYNGDPVYHRNGAPDYGVTFNSGSLAIPSKSGGGLGEFSTPPTPPSAAGQVEGSELSFTLDQGMWLESLSFAYDATPGSAPRLLLYSGTAQQDAISLGLCTAPPSGASFCGWTDYKLPDTVLAGLKDVRIDRVSWTAAPNQLVVDSVQVGTNTATPVPEPSSIALALFGLSLTTWSVRRRGRR